MIVCALCNKREARAEEKVKFEQSEICDKKAATGFAISDIQYRN